MKNSENKSKAGSKVLLYTMFAAAVVAVVLSYTLDFSKDETTDALAKGTFTRLVLSALLLTVLIRSKMLCSDFSGFAKKLLWCLPCFLTVVANFPFGALIGGTATLARGDLLWLFLLECLAIGLMEELFFRGIVHRLLLDKFGKRREWLAVFVSSAIFGAWHLFNLLEGASVGGTLLQVGYSFLIGAMLAVTLDRTENLWLCVLLHFLFDVGGNLISALGSSGSSPWELSFWIATALCGALCTVHIILTSVKMSRSVPHSATPASF